MGQDSFQNKQQSQILAVIIDVHASISLDFGHASITFTGSVRQQRGVIKIVFTFVCNLKKKLNMQTNFNFLCMPGLLRYAETTLRGLTQLPVHFTCGLFLFLFSVRSVTFTVLEPCHCCLFCVIQDPSQNPVFHRQQLDDADLDEHRMAVHFAPF